jgi:hypothetical protein
MCSGHSTTISVDHFQGPGISVERVEFTAIFADREGAKERTRRQRLNQSQGCNIHAQVSSAMRLKCSPRELIGMYAVALSGDMGGAIRRTYRSLVWEALGVIGLGRETANPQSRYQA